MADSHASKVHGGYVEVERLDDPDGARAIISRRIASPALFTVMFAKHYRDARDAPAQTTFFTKRALASLVRLIPIAEARMEELEAAEEAGRAAEPTKSVGRRS